MVYDVVDGFEFQVASNQGFAGGGPGIYQTAALATVQTSGARNGSACMRVAPTAAASGRIVRDDSTTGISLTQGKTWSFGIKFTTFPSSNADIAKCSGTAGMLIRYDTASGKLRLHHSVAGTGSVFGPVLSTGTWYLVDWKIDMSTTSHVNTARVDGALEATTTEPGQTIQNMGRLVLGTDNTGGPAYTVDFDDWVVTDTSADYPLGDHKVVACLPTSDGGHNPGTNTMEDNTGADITGSTTTAWQLVDAIPPANTVYIQQATASSTAYAEVAYADASGSDVPLGVQVYSAIEAAAGGASGAIVRTVDSGGSTVIEQGSATGATNGTTRCYTAEIIPAPGGSWDASEFNALKTRVGFATDVTPTPRYLALMLQYSAPVSLDQSFTPAVIDHTLQAVQPLIQPPVTPSIVDHTLSAPAPLVTFSTLPLQVTATVVDHTLSAFAPTVGDITVSLEPLGAFVDIYDDSYTGGIVSMTLSPFDLAVTFSTGTIEIAPVITDHTLFTFDLLEIQNDQNTYILDKVDHTLTLYPAVPTFGGVDQTALIGLLSNPLTLFDPVVQGPIALPRIVHTLSPFSPVVDREDVEVVAGLPRLVAEMDLGNGMEPITAFVRTFSWSRGRTRERERMGAGTASFVLDNRSGKFDRDQNPEVRPNRRVTLGVRVDSGIGMFRMGRSALGGSDALLGGSLELAMFTGRTEGGPTAFVQNTDSFVSWTAVDASKRLNRDRSATGYGVSDALTGDRVAEVLAGTTPTWQAGQVVDPGLRTIRAETGVLGRYDYLLQVAESEGGVFFIDASGRAVFRDSTYSPPADEIPFGDIDGEQRYKAIVVEDDDKEIFNAVTVSSGNLQDEVAEDPASQAEYGRSDLSLSTLLSNPGEMSDLAFSVLDTYSEPHRRIGQLVLGTRGTDWHRVLSKEIGDQVIVRYRPRYGGMFEQQVAIQGTQVSAASQYEWEVTWNLAPPLEQVFNPNLLTAAQSSIESPSDMNSWQVFQVAGPQIVTPFWNNGFAYTGHASLGVQVEGLPQLLAWMRATPYNVAPVEPGETYRCTAYFMSRFGPILVQTGIEFVNTVGSQISLSSGNQSWVDQYQWGSATFTQVAPTGAVYARAHVIAVDPYNSIFAATIDAVSLRKVG